MNRSIIYAAALALLLAACSPGTQPTELEPVPPVAAPEEPAVTLVPADPADANPAAPGDVPAQTSDPQGTIGISADNETFVTSTGDALNAVSVPAGSTFYLELTFADPDGISDAQVYLRNSADAGPLPTGPFTIASNDCETAVELTPTELTCTVAVTVAPDAQNIQQPGETAYAFRPFISDTAGNNSLAFSWAYLNVEPQ